MSWTLTMQIFIFFLKSKLLILVSCCIFGALSTAAVINRSTFCVESPTTHSARRSTSALGERRWHIFQIVESGDGKGGFFLRRHPRSQGLPEEGTNIWLTCVRTRCVVASTRRLSSPRAVKSREPPLMWIRCLISRGSNWKGCARFLWWCLSGNVQTAVSWIKVQVCQSNVDFAVDSGGNLHADWNKVFFFFFFCFLPPSFPWKLFCHVTVSQKQGRLIRDTTGSEPPCSWLMSFHSLISLEF